MKVGAIFFSSPRNPGFYSRAVKYFTKSKWSHCFYVGPAYMGELMAIETDLKLQVVPFQKEYVEKNEDVYEAFYPQMASSVDVLNAAKLAFRETAGQTYGFLSIPWFAVRAKLGHLFSFKKNYSTSGAICSELLVKYIRALGGEYEKCVSHLTDDETSPEDLYTIVLSRQDLFKRIGENA